MCGRFAITLPPEILRDYFGYADQPNFPPRALIRPTEPVPIVRLEAGERRFVLVRWGFIPGFVKDEREFPLLFNARAETVFEKASFRNAIRRRRCLFLCNAFYESQKLDEKGRKKRSFLIRRPMQEHVAQKWSPVLQNDMRQDKASEPIALAGIWENWQSPNGSEIDTAAILTTAANATLSAIHERMPVILEPRDFSAWLAPETPVQDVERLLCPLDDEALELVPFDTATRDLFV